VPVLACCLGLVCVCVCHG